MKKPAFHLVISDENKDTLFFNVEGIYNRGALHVINKVLIFALFLVIFFCFLQTGLNMESNNTTWWPVNNSGSNSSYFE